MRSILLCSFVGTTIFASSATLPRALGAVPVEGDFGLLQLLLDAQETNRSLFNRGQLKAVARESVEGIEAQATIIWDGNRTCWTSYKTRQVAAVKTRAEPQVLGRQGRMIEVPGALMCYWPDSKFSQKITDGSAGYQSILKLRPDDVWFKLERRHDWKTLLDPKAAGNNVTKFVVRRSDDDNDRVIVERHYDSGSVLEIHASLRMNGNIVSYSKTLGPEKDTSWREGSYDWAQDSDGHWYLKRYAYKWAPSGDPSKPVQDYTLEVIDFNPEPDILADRFQFASLKLADGTTVEEIGGKGRTYRIGKKQQPEETLQQSLLERLAEKLKASGFAAPEKKK